VRNKYQRKDRKSNYKFEVVGGQELMVRVPLPMAEVWAEMQSHCGRADRASRAADPARHAGKRSHASGGASASAELIRN
jgi:hypothetical protein